MAAFDAGSAVEAMDWDFSKYGGGKGVVPEPSTTDMKVFQNAFSRITRDSEKLNVSAEEMRKMSEEDFTQLQKKGDELSDRLDEAIAKLCKNQPSAEQVEKLPFRVKTAFSKWLMEQFNPEAEAAATTK